MSNKEVKIDELSEGQLLLRSWWEEEGPHCGLSNEKTRSYHVKFIYGSRPLKCFTRWISFSPSFSFLQNSFQRKINTDFLILYYSIYQVKF